MATVPDVHRASSWVASFISAIQENIMIWESLSDFKCNYNKSLLSQSSSVKKYVAKLERNNINEVYFTVDGNQYNIEIVFNDEPDKIFQLPFLDKYNEQLQVFHKKLEEHLENRLLIKLSVSNLF